MSIEVVAPSEFIGAHTLVVAAVLVALCALAVAYRFGQTATKLPSERKSSTTTIKVIDSAEIDLSDSDSPSLANEEGLGEAGVAHDDVAESPLLAPGVPFASMSPVRQSASTVSTSLPNLSTLRHDDGRRGSVDRIDKNERHSVESDASLDSPEESPRSVVSDDDVFLPFGPLDHEGHDDRVPYESDSSTHQRDAHFGVGLSATELAEHQLLETPDVRSFSSLIHAYAQERRVDDALALFERMTDEGVRPNVVCYASLIHACAQGSRVEHAVDLFNRMEHDGIEADVVCYSSMLHALAQARRVDDALELFERIKSSNVRPNVVTFNTLINACARGRRDDKAQEVFETMRENGVDPDVVTYNFLLASYSRAQRFDDVKATFDEMIERGVEPNYRTYNTVIPALAQGKCVDEALAVFERVERTGIYANSWSHQSLLHILAVRERLDDAMRVYRCMKERSLRPSVRTFSMLIKAQRSPKNAQELYDDMHELGVKPDSFVFSALLIVAKRSRSRGQAIQWARDFLHSDARWSDVILDILARVLNERAFNDFCFDHAESIAAAQLRVSAGRRKSAPTDISSVATGARRGSRDNSQQGRPQRRNSNFNSSSGSHGRGHHGRTTRRRVARSADSGGRRPPNHHSGGVHRGHNSTNHHQHQHHHHNNNNNNNNNSRHRLNRRLQLLKQGRSHPQLPSVTTSFTKLERRTSQPDSGTSS